MYRVQPSCQQEEGWVDLPLCGFCSVDVFVVFFIIILFVVAQCSKKTGSGCVNTLRDGRIQAPLYSFTEAVASMLILCG